MIKVVAFIIASKIFILVQLPNYFNFDLVLTSTIANSVGVVSVPGLKAFLFLLKEFIVKLIRSSP